MKKNRILSLIVTLAMLAGLLAAFPTVSYATETSGKAGLTSWWKMNYDWFMLDVGGTGTTSSFVGNEDARWCAKIVTVLDGITGLGRKSFNNYARLKQIFLADSITEIGECAIPETDIMVLRLPKNLVTIGDDAFLLNTKLREVSIGDKVQRIGRGAFAGCFSLHDVYYDGSYMDWQKIDIAKGSSEYGTNVNLLSANIHYKKSSDLGNGLKWTFYDDMNDTLLIYKDDDDSNGIMKNFSDPESVDWYAFRDKIKNIRIYNGVKNIGDYAFYGCTNLESVSIPSSVTSIGKYAFKNSIIRQNLVIPDSVTSIGEGAFMDSYMRGDTTLPDSLSSIGDGAFSAAQFEGNIIVNYSKKSVLDDISVGGGNKSLMNHIAVFAGDPRGDCPKTSEDTVGWSVSNDVLVITGAGKMADFASASDVPWLSYRDDIKKIIIDDEVTSIGKNAFAYHRNLEQVEITGDITEIGRGAFANCSSLRNIYLPASVAVMASSNAGQNGKYVFNDSTALESIDIDAANAIFSQYDGALYSKDMTRLIQYPLGKLQSDFTVPDGVETIGGVSFSGAVNLETVTIPLSVTAIEQDAFRSCNSLTDIYYEGTEYDWANIYGAVYDDKVKALYNGGHVHFAPENNSCGANLSYTITNGTLYINGTGAMYDWDSFIDVPWCFDRNDIDEVVIGSGVTHIGDHAFYGCAYLGDVTIPDSVTSIGDYAFAKCPYLTAIDFPQYLESIGDYAFWDCTDLMTITLPNSCETVGESAFRGCSSLLTATLSTSLDKVSWAMFADCAALTSITLPAGVTEIENNAFNGCTSLETITLPDTVETIGNGAFFGCDGLRYVYYGGSYGDRQNNVKTGAKTRKVNDANWRYGVTHTLSLVPAAEPTCSSPGHAAYYECSHCDKLFEDSDAVHEVSLADIQIPAKTHNLAHRFAKAATCQSEGCIEHYECIYCHMTFADDEGETRLYNVDIPETAHDVEWMQPTEATCEEPGYDAHYECVNCHTFFTGPEGMVEDIPDIHITDPATGHDWEFTEWYWSKDCSSCFALFTCQNDSEHVMTVDAEITSEVAEGDYYEDHTVTTYTATVTFEGETYTDTRKRTSAYFGLLESNDERIVDYSLFLDEGELWINGDISVSEPVYVGFYDIYGKLKNLRLYTEETLEADEIEITPDITKIKVMWWEKATMKPNSANAEIELQ